MRPYIPHSSDITIMDMFCGAGGSSEGARRVPGVRIRYALNHWDRAIETHNHNFPNTEHVLTDVQETRPERFARTDILIASPSCTNHSLAKGKRKGEVALQLDLPWDGDEDGPPLPLSAEERSRATMWDVLKWCRFHLFNYVILENVVDVRSWQHYPLWLSTWTTLDYEFHTVYVNSQFFPPTPQSRDRWYFVAWRRGNPAPNLTYHPPAFCPPCEQIVGAVQAWKKPRKPWGRYGTRRQYVYRCPLCTGMVRPFYQPAATAIDWSLPTPRIGDRQRPLRPKTLARIEEGLRRFQDQQPFLIQVNKTTNRFTAMTDPLRTQTGDNGQALVAPSSFTFCLNHQPRVTNTQAEVLPTQTTYDETGLVVLPNACLLDLLQEYRVRDITGPHSTVCTRGNHHALVTFPFIAELHGGGSSVRPLTEALATVCAGGLHHGLVMPPVPRGLLTTYYQNGQTIDPYAVAMPTATTHDRHGLLTLPAEQRQALTDIDLMDCGFRMLEPHEIQAAMAFPQDYVLLGTRREKVKLAGNAVTPPVMEWLVRACVEAMRG